MGVDADASSAILLLGNNDANHDVRNRNALQNRRIQLWRIILTRTGSSIQITSATINEEKKQKSMRHCEWNTSRKDQTGDNGPLRPIQKEIILRDYRNLSTTPTT